jgi:hypothetical protein
VPKKLLFSFYGLCFGTESLHSRQAYRLKNIYQEKTTNTNVPLHKLTGL